ncbi:MAG TPA: polysaccharide biosynthesis protein, partial [Peptococcaceae bacterium]|nr:polysaccharide biosynthesis protein [Peptococcaceae bacterium]
MSHPKRTLFFMLLDAVLINLALFGSFYLRFEEGLPAEYIKTYINASLVATVALLIAFHLFGLYRNIWRYASVGELLSIVYAVSVGAAVTITIVYFISPMRLPHSVSALFWLILIVLVGGLRFSARVRQENSIFAVRNKDQRKVLIVGAGDAGVLALRELKKRDYLDGMPVGFIDDSRSKINLHVQGFPVLGSREDIPQIVEKYNVDE